MPDSLPTKDQELQTVTGGDRLDALIERHPLPTWRLVAWPVILAVVLGLVWAFFAELDEVTVAEGVVAPQGDLKVIQHLEGGIIQQIHVREGSRVKQNQALLRLDIRGSTVNREELQVRSDGQLVLKARLEAEAGDKAIACRWCRWQRPWAINAA